MAELRMTVTGTIPGTPPTNQVSIYARSNDKRIYVKDDSGTEFKLMTNEAVLDGLTGQAPINVSAGQSPVVSISNVTTSTNGAMLYQDKLKLDEATAVATADKLVIRDGLGNAAFNEVTATVFNGNATSVTTVPALVGNVTTNGTSNATTIASGVIVDSMISATAGIALTKLATLPTDRSNHIGTQLAATISDFGISIDSHLTSTAPIVNAMIDASAAIELTKLATDPLDRTNHTGTQTASSISDFTTQVNLDVASYLTANPITNAEIDAAAAIDLSKLATDPLDRANHTGTQTVSTLSDFSTAVPLQLTAGNGIDGTPLSTGTIDVLGTTDRIDTSGGTVDIASTYVGQASINTLGTITTGEWQGLTVDTLYGGTGAASRGGARNNLLAVETISTSEVLDDGDNVLLVDATASILALTLPAATTRSQFTFKKLDNVNNIIINVEPGDTIDGATSYTLTTQYQYVTIVSNLSTQWFIVAEG